MVKVFPAQTSEHFQHIRDLTREYIAFDVSHTRALGLDPDVLLEYQYTHGEEPLSGDYAPPEGCLLLATVEGTAAGCGAFHKFDSEVCELKRLYVCPDYRGHGIGRILVESLIARAREAGYERMKLETVTFMGAAINLYKSLGFQVCDPYYQIPASFLKITVFMDLDLHQLHR